MTTGDSRVIGVVVMAYGGPDSLADVEPYLMDVRGHRPTAPHVVDEVRARYASIGGRSPILERTRAQAAAIARALGADDAGSWKVVVGMRHWHPFIAQSLGELAAAGVTRAVGVVMAPHFSKMSIGAYEKRIADAASGIDVRTVQSWHLLPGYVQAVAEGIDATLGRLDAAERPRAPILFTAHSLPQRILEWGDPYPTQLNETVAAVMTRVGERKHRFAFQSAAMTPEPWLGPDARDVLRDLAGAGHRSVVVAPIGFTCEHVEILYDVDIELQRLARELGVRLERVPMLDDAPGAMEGIAALVRDTARVAGW
jgi:protoporphyrin/coproporphyrin ferrochelatase